MQPSWSIHEPTTQIQKDGKVGLMAEFSFPQFLVNYKFPKTKFNLDVHTEQPQYVNAF